MSNVIEKKKQVVEEIADKFKGSQSTVLVNYRGLDVAAVTELRQQLREAGVDFKVYKNTMSRRAAEASGLSELNDTLVGPTAIAFSEDDVIAPAKILNNFAKGNEALEIKGGIIEGEIVSIDKIKELADLPGYEGMISMLLSVLQAPIRNLAYVTQAIADEKEGESGEGEEA